MKYSIEDLIQIMNDLREKCPWDKKQTLDSLKTLTIEEAYELIEAIDKEDYNEIKEELGDLLLHVVFYSKIASEINQFNFDDVIESLIKKLIYRHPHIYSDEKVNNEDDVKKNWEKLKSNGIDKEHFTRVLRSDKVNKNILYAGTETGMYISYDKGKSWNKFQKNLPIVPITDLTIKDNSLIVATQGRSIWILDDLTVIHQLSPSIDQEKLYKPKK